jgi:hypothetical protein
MARPDPSGLVCMGDFAQLAHVQQEVNRLREDLKRGNDDGVVASSPISDWKQRQLPAEDMPLLDEMSAAVELGDTGAVYSLLQRGAPVDAMNESGVTALMIAAYIGSLEMLQLILQFGADPDQRNKNGGTALMNAASTGHKDVVLELVSAAAAPFLDNNKGKTALDMAEHSGHRECAELLMMCMLDTELGNEGDAEDVYWSERQESMELLDAAESGQMDRVESLLDYGEDVDSCDAGGTTALVCASGNGHDDIVSCA